MLGKKVLITGGTSGVGLQLTKLLLERGVYVTAVGRRIEELEGLKYDNLLSIHRVDFLNEKDFSKFMDWIDGQVGFDYLINCAGFAEYGPLLNQKDEVIQDMIQVNFIQTVIMTKHVIARMHAGSMVVTIGSQSAHVTTPFGSIYAASKSGLMHVMNALRLELPHIHFLTVNTGPVNTNFIQKANKGKPVNQLAEKVQLDVNQLSDKIIDAMIQKKTELNLPKWMDSGLKVYHLAPRTIEKVFKKYFLTKK